MAKGGIVKKTIVKIDLVNSKEFYGKHSKIDSQIRTKTLGVLYQKIRDVFPYADKNVPDGTLYETQGDCAYLVMDKPTVAIRCAIEFMRAWFSTRDEIPDCRAIIDLADVEESDVNGRTDLASEGFDVISVVEKNYGAGIIAVTNRTKDAVDRTMVQFVHAESFAINSTLSLTCYQVKYDDPRLVRDSSFVHALFIGSVAGDQARVRTIEALLLSALESQPDRRQTAAELVDWVAQQGAPAIPEVTILNIARQSQYLTVSDSNHVGVNEALQERITSIRGDFERDQESTVNAVESRLSATFGIPVIDLRRKLSVVSLIEQYLCAVFLEVRLMANYFQSTSTLFEKLSTAVEYDYVLRAQVRELLGNSTELFNKFKSEFLKSLSVAASSDNRYIAAIFHNVLMLYYLNRNPNYLQNQIARLKSKRVFLDTNVLYALKCAASQFHIAIRYTLSKLHKLGVELCIFDQSVLEYNESLLSTLHRSRSRDAFRLELNEKQPWIWQEYSSDPAKYSNSFPYCVAVHRVPRGDDPDATIDLDGAAKELQELGITIVPMGEREDRLSLGDLYDDVFKSKRKYNTSGEYWEPIVNFELYESQVLHDANCLRKLECEGANPMETENVFVTCDYKLAGIRRMRRGQFGYLVTVTEFSEFMMPYLFIADALYSEPVVLPNFLLAGAISQDLGNSADSNETLRRQLSSKAPINEDTVILSKILTDERFQRLQKAFDGEGARDPETTGQDIAYVMHKYQSELQGEVSRRLFRDEKVRLEGERNELSKENEDLKREIERLRERSRRSKAYDRRMRRKKGEP